jgi:hypothetical protein
MAAPGGNLKRNLVDLYFGQFTVPTPDQQLRLENLSAMDDHAVATSPAGFLAEQFFEFMNAEHMAPSFTFLVPASEPDQLPWTWDTLGEAAFVFFVVEIKCGEVLMARKIGSHNLPADTASLGSVEGWSLNYPPDRFLVARMGEPDYTPVEKEIAAFLRKGSSGGGTSALTSRQGFYTVLDLTGKEHRVSSKASGVERMAIVNGLARELDPARFKEFLVDLVFEPVAFKAKCLEYRDKTMAPTDPNSSLALIPYVTNREVWKHNDRFRAAFLGQWSRTNWTTISVRDFRRPGTAVWGRQSTFDGRLALIDALDGYEMFCRALKGEVFKDCMKPIIVLIKRIDQPMRIYDDIYIQYQIEGLLCAYYSEVCKHEGQRSKRFPFQALVTPADCVAFFGLLVDDFVTAALAPGTHPGGWEVSPHHITYGPETLFTAIEKSSEEVSAPHGKSGLCMWYLAGQLGLKNALGTVYECRAAGAHHVPLCSVKHDVVKELVRDVDFLASCKHASIKDALRTAVDTNGALFA